MLQGLREKSGGLVAKIILLFLIGSFALWGIADYASGPAGGNIVAKIGGEEINIQQLAFAYRNDLAQGRLSNIDPETQRQLRLAHISLDPLINNALLRAEAKEQGLYVADEAVSKLLNNNPQFQDAHGRFDRNQFDIIFARSGLSEKAFIEQLKSDFIATQLMGAGAPISPAPTKLAQILFDHAALQKQASLLTLERLEEDMPAPPTETDLVNYFEAASEDFRVPEMRELSFIWLSVPRMVSAITIDEGLVRERYEMRKTALSSPETRRITQILLEGVENANAVEMAVKAGDSLESLIASGALPASNINELGDLSQADFPDPVLAEAAFSLTNIGATPVLEGLFGKVILLVQEITAAKTPSFEAVKVGLHTQMVEEEAVQRLPEAMEAIEDLLGQGMTLSEIARITGHILEEMTLSVTGETHEKTKPALPQGIFLEEAFALADKEIGFLTQNDQGESYVIEVKAIAPSHVPSLNSIKSEVEQAYINEKAFQNLEARAQKLADRVNEGERLEQVAKAHHGRIRDIASFNRYGRGKGENNQEIELIEPVLATAIFATKKEKAGILPVADASDASPPAFQIFSVTKTIMPDRHQQAGLFESTQSNLARRLQNERLQAYLQTLRTRYQVEIYDEAIERIY